jgi:hypothetical protein
MNIFNISTYCHIGIVEAGKGLTNVANGEMIRFGISEEGLVLYFLEKNKISDENIHKKPGQFVIRTFQGPIYTNTESRARTSVVDTDSKTWKTANSLVGNWILYVPKTVSHWKR